MLRVSGAAAAAGLRAAKQGRAFAVPGCGGNVRWLWGWSEKSEEARAPLAAELIQRTESIYEESIAPLNKRLMGPLEDRQGGPPRMPFVLLVGNHSSGKSTFINYVLQRDVQKAGVAPTDDSFTLIMPGDRDVDQGGPALVGDPDLGFSSLRRFGSGLINHVNLKVRRELALQDVMLIDSPGAIDSPIASTRGDGVVELASARDRGYDFHSVVRWFAEHADVILLFFDPDKPVRGIVPRATRRYCASCACGSQAVCGMRLNPHHGAGHHGGDADVSDGVPGGHGPQAAHYPEQSRPVQAHARLCQGVRVTVLEPVQGHPTQRPAQVRG